MNSNALLQNPAFLCLRRFLVQYMCHSVAHVEHCGTSWNIVPHCGTLWHLYHVWNMLNIVAQRATKWHTVPQWSSKSHMLCRYPTPPLLQTSRQRLHPALSGTVGWTWIVALNDFISAAKSCDIISTRSRSVQRRVPMGLYTTDACVSGVGCQRGWRGKNND